MGCFHLSVIPAQAGIPWLQVLRDPRFRGDDSRLVFFDTLLMEIAASPSAPRNIRMMNHVVTSGNRHGPLDPRMRGDDGDYGFCGEFC